jgi:hypothetical protein
MSIRRKAIISASLGVTLVSVPAVAEPRLFDAAGADQLLGPIAEDLVPEDPAMRQIWAEHTAFDAVIFGRPAVQTYTQMHHQAIDQASPGYTGFNIFAHGRDLAGPGYKPFKTPNADTLYSNAFLDLSAGPVLITVPPTDGRYYTLNFLDLFGNATNISARTHGTSGGTYLITTTDWGGEVPTGATLFRVTQPYMWILMRIEVESAAELPDVRALQDRFAIARTTAARQGAAFPAPAALDDLQSFLKVLDWVVKNAGVRTTEAALVNRFRGLGVGGRSNVAAALIDAHTRAGATAGLARANALIAKVKSQNGRMDSGWREPFDIGRYGYNYLYRAGVHDLGLGANVRLENYAFTTFIDAEGAPLQGANGPYEIRLGSAPPSDFFWSITVYDAATQELFPNPSGKYLAGANTPGLVTAEDGSITITLTRNADSANDIPVPEGQFYLALRAQGPRRPMIDGTWRPSPVRMVSGSD